MRNVAVRNINALAQIDRIFFAVTDYSHNAALHIYSCFDASRRIVKIRKPQYGSRESPDGSFRRKRERSRIGKRKRIDRSKRRFGIERKVNTYFFALPA